MTYDDEPDLHTGIDEKACFDEWWKQFRKERQLQWPEATLRVIKEIAWEAWKASTIY